MRAIQLRAPGGLDHLILVDLPPAAEPGPGEIKVALHASSLNYHDYFVASGLGKHADGLIPMSDGAGSVVAVGAGVTQFAEGDSVMSMFFPDWFAGDRTDNTFASVPGDGCDGYARTEVTAPATAFTRAPSGYSHLEAATLPCAGLTAWRCVMQDGFKPGDTVLVLGTGGVSVFALQFAKAAGGTVIATSSSSEKMERLRQLGADHVLNYRETPDWGDQIFKLTGGGVDHVVEVGGPGTLDQSMLACRNGGRVALIGVFTGFAGPVSTGLIMRRQIRLTGITVGNRQQQLDLVRAIEATDIRPVIDSSYPLEKLADAFRHQGSGRHFGKIGVTIDS